MRTFEGWDYPPFGYESESEIPEEAARYHLDVTSMMPKRRDVMVTVMCPRRDGEDAAVVDRILEDSVRGANIAWQGNTYRIEASVDLDQDRPLRGLEVTLSGGAGEGQYHIAVEGAGDATGITIDAEAVAR
jgi:hypothetical protein